MNAQTIQRVSIARRVRGDMTPPGAAGKDLLVVKRYASSGDAEVMLRQNGALKVVVVNRCDIIAEDRV